MVSFEQQGDIIQVRKLEREKLQCNEKVSKTEKKKKKKYLLFHALKRYNGKGHYMQRQSTEIKA